MTKTKTGKVEQYVKAISSLKAAKHDWPQGYSDPIIQGRLEHFVRELLDELYEILNQKKGRQKSERINNSFGSGK